MRRAFTLVEMAVVLAVLALAVHMAVRELRRVREAALAKSADSQLEEIRRSVWDFAPGSGPSGFLADMGRLPRVSGDGTLRELWSIPGGARPYAVVAATAGNLAVPDAEKPFLADPSVFVPTGWRGPYLRLPLSRTRLLDPWGNPVEETDDAGLCRVWTTNGFACAVSHYGPDASAEGVRTLPLVPDGGAAARLVVTAEFPSGDGFAGDVTYSWYGPAGGLVTGAVETVAYPAAAVFEGLTPGTRILKDSVSGAARAIDVRPGDNLVHLKLPAGGR